MNKRQLARHGLGVRVAVIERHAAEFQQRRARQAGNA
jgi:hypothetical protein